MATLLIPHLVPVPIRRPVAALYAIEKNLARQIPWANPGEATVLAAYRSALEGSLADVLSRWQRGLIGMKDAIAELEALEGAAIANDGNVFGVRT